MIKYSFVVPIYHDGHLAENFCKEFETVFKDYIQKPSIEGDVELIFVNDGSKDGSYNSLITATKKYPFAKAIDLSKNFGQHIAITCGYHHAKGAYVGMLNVDMQDHPREIPKLLQVLEKNDCDIVIGLRSKREDNFFARISSTLFCYAMNVLTGQDVPLNTATLRIMNRKFLDAYNQINEKSRYLPALESWLGFKHAYIETVHGPACAGKISSYTLKRKLLMALEAVLGFSDRPLKFVAILGFMVATLGILLGLGLIIDDLFFRHIQHGYSSTLCIIFFLGGMQIFVTGLCGLYVGRTLHEVQGRPLYLISSTTFSVK